MVSVSPKCLDTIKGDSLVVDWSGTIKLTDNTVYNFTHRNIDNGSGEINLSCSSMSEIGIGNAYLGEFVARLLDLDVDRYLLKGAVINLNAIVSSGRADISTWGEAGDYTWRDLKNNTWRDLLNGVSIRYVFPFGVFVVEEAMRSNNAIKITSYDNMHKLDTNLPAPMPTGEKFPYDWIKLACTTCGVSMGFTKQEALRMPNGNRLLVFADTNTDVKTWRDIVAEAAAVMGGNAMMDRNGRLVVRHYGKRALDCVPAGFRYSSDFSDYQCYYTGIYLSYKDGGVVDYQRNTTQQLDTGLAYDLGFNAFLQISDEGARHRAMKEIIDAMAGKSYTPFKVSMPFNPAYDLMDVIEFNGNQAAAEDVAPVTAMTVRIGGRMDVSCGGENPALQEAQTKESKAIESVANGSGYNDDFWMVIGNAPDESSVTINADTRTKIGEALFYAKEALSMFQVAYTATYNLDKTSLIQAEVVVDDVSIYTTQENQWPGENRMTLTTGFLTNGTGSHSIEIYLTVKESTLDVGGGGVLMERGITANGMYIAADDGVYGYSKVTALIDDSMGYYAGLEDVTSHYTPAVFNAIYGDFFDMQYESAVALYNWQSAANVSSYDSDYVTLDGEDGVQIICTGFHYEGTAGTIDAGYLNVCEIPTNSFVDVYEISAYATSVENLLSLSQLDLNNWTPAPVSWTHQVTFDRGLNRVYQVAQSGWEDFVTEIDVEPNTDYIATLRYNCPAGYTSYGNQGRRLYVWNQTWTYSNAQPNLADNRLLGYSGTFSAAASDTPVTFTVRFNSGSNTKVKLEINIADVIDGTSAIMIFQDIAVKEA